MTVYVKKINEGAMESQDEKFGMLHRSVIGAMCSMVNDGAGLMAILDLKQFVDGLNSTIWALFCLNATSAKNDRKADETIKEQEIQLERMFNEVLEITRELSLLRERKSGGH